LPDITDDLSLANPVSLTVFELKMTTPELVLVLALSRYGSGVHTFPELNYDYSSVQLEDLGKFTDKEVNEFGRWQLQTSHKAAICKKLEGTYDYRSRGFFTKLIGKDAYKELSELAHAKLPSVFDDDVLVNTPQKLAYTEYALIFEFIKLKNSINNFSEIAQKPLIKIVESIPVLSKDKFIMYYNCFKLLDIRIL